MTSILTNTASMAALQTLRAVGANLASQQTQVSSGLRVSAAADNVAYWSISTTMKSDRLAVSSADDAMGVGVAKVDTAYAAMNSVIDILSDFKAKLVTAKESSTDLDKIQSDLDQLKKQVVSISDAASFSGQNWLTTDVEDIYDEDLNRTTVVSGFTRGTDGSVSVNTAEHVLAQTSLFNSTGGGILQADPRDLKTIGGIRFEFGGGSMSSYALRNTVGSAPGAFTFDFSAPVTFAADDSISFSVTVDQDNPADGISAPYDPGQTTPVTITAAKINTALGRTDGTINDYKEYAAVLRSVLAGSGLTAKTYTRYEPPNQTTTWVDIPDIVGIVRQGIPSKDGSSMAISGVTFNGVADVGQIGNKAVSYGVRSSSMTLDFQEFKVYDDVVVSLRLTVDRAYESFSFDKDFVNTTLGKDDGKVETAAEMATLLDTLFNRADLTIAAAGAGSILVETNPLVDRKSGEKSGIGIDGISVNIEPVPTMNFLDVDVAANPMMLDTYVSYIETVLGRTIDGAASLGSLQMRLDMQSNFANKMMDMIDSGVGRLIDADMEEASAKLSALQTQQQLAVQSLQISNQTPERLLMLFN